MGKEKTATDQEMLQELVNMIYADITGKGDKFKVTDLLRAIELKRKLAPADDNERKFWHMIGEIRSEEIPPGADHPAFRETQAPENTRDTNVEGKQKLKCAPKQIERRHSSED